MSRALSRILLVSGSLLLAGCASYSGIQPDAKPLDIASLGGTATATPYAGWPKEDWWRELGDPVLTGLIEQALADSPDLQAATARLKRAKAAVGVAESALWPQIDASSSVTRERFSERGEFPPPYAGTTENIDDFQIGGQWELDFFGKNREGLKAALGELRASEAEHQAARIMLASDVARAYYKLAQLLSQRKVAEQRSSQRVDFAALVERRFRAGIDTRVEFEATHGEVSETARDIESLDEQISLARHALAALVGQGPEALDAVAPSLPPVAHLALPSVLPANLLGHRADVAAARWRVESALHGLESKKALFYPNINLLAFTGYTAIGFDNWMDAGNRQPGIGLAVSLPIFDAGRLRGIYRSSAATVDSSIATYNGALLGALRDVADQLATLKAVEAQFSREQAVLASAARIYDLALTRYRAGITDRLAVLNAETNLIAQRRAAVDLQARWIDGRIRLIRALGGGFKDAASPALVSAPNPATTNN